MSADTSQTITVTDGNGFEPWYLEWGSGVWKKTYISITDYSEDGTLDHSTSETFRVRSRKGNEVTICKPEDDDEPNVFPGTYWREP